MRITPLKFITNNFSNKTNKSQTKFEKTDANTQNLKRNSHHKYSGVASADLAYASMFDNSIAQDLKLMGLI